MLVALHLEAPLVTELNLAYSLRTPWTIHLSSTGIALFSCAVVFHSATVADQVVTRRLMIAVVAGAKLNNTIALLLGYPLD